VPLYGELAAIPEAGVLRVVVESPAGATTKIKYEPAIDAFMLSRPLPLGLAYPHDWGFIPSTLGPDGDPLDVLALCEGTTFPGLVIATRPIAVLRLEQAAPGGRRARNDRLVVVPCSSRRRAGETELSSGVREELERFFVDAVFFERKDPVLLGWGGAEDAWQLVERSLVKTPTSPPKP
jgi:inorganic pyrophosphatase